MEIGSGNALCLKIVINNLIVLFFVHDTLC